MLSRPVVALVPLRSPGEGKTRLAAAGLSPIQRARLSAAMLADVTSALRTAPVDTIVVAAAGAEAAAAATALDLDVLVDPPGLGSLDAAVAAALARIVDVGSLLVLMADLPRLDPTDVAAVLAADASVVVAPTSDGGTGALLRTPPTAIPTAYGPRSASRHLDLAHRAGVDAETVRTAGFADDVDTVEDLRLLTEGRLGPATRHVLDRLLAELA